MMPAGTNRSPATNAAPGGHKVPKVLEMCGKVVGRRGRVGPVRVGRGQRVLGVRLVWGMMVVRMGGGKVGVLGAQAGI